MSQVYKSMSIANPDPVALDGSQKLFATIGSLGLLILIVASFGINLPNSRLWLALSLVLMAAGVIGFSYQTFRTQAPGIKNNGIWFSSAMSRGIVGWTMGILITGFYILLYWYPSLLGLAKMERSIQV